MPMSKALDVDIIVHLTESNQRMKHFGVVHGDIEPDEIAAGFNSERGAESRREESDD